MGVGLQDPVGVGRGEEVAVPVHEPSGLRVGESEREWLRVPGDGVVLRTALTETEGVYVRVLGVSEREAWRVREAELERVRLRLAVDVGCSVQVSDRVQLPVRDAVVREAVAVGEALREAPVAEAV